MFTSPNFEKNAYLGLARGLIRSIPQTVLATYFRWRMHSCIPIWHLHVTQGFPACYIHVTQGFHCLLYTCDTGFPLPAIYMFRWLPEAVIRIVWGHGSSAHTTEKWPIESEIGTLNLERMVHWNFSCHSKNGKWSIPWVPIPITAKGKECCQLFLTTYSISQTIFNCMAF